MAKKRSRQKIKARSPSGEKNVMWFVEFLDEIGATYWTHILMLPLILMVTHDLWGPTGSQLRRRMARP